MSLLASSIELFLLGPSLGLAKRTNSLGLVTLTNSASYKLWIGMISRQQTFTAVSFRSGLKLRIETIRTECTT